MERLGPCNPEKPDNRALLVVVVPWSFQDSLSGDSESKLSALQDSDHHSSLNKIQDT